MGRVHPPERRSHVISFRHLFSGEIASFLRTEALDFQNAVSVISEVVVALARYREEGTPLYPEVFLCRDVARTVEELGGFDAVVLGRATLDCDGVRRALKRAAPLGGVGWAVFFSVDDATSSFSYGVFRTDPFVLHPTAMDRLRAADMPFGNVLGMWSLEENVIELRASHSVFRHVYLSGARSESELGPVTVDRLVTRLGTDLEPLVRNAIQAFWRRVLGEALRQPHGMLVAVVRPDTDPRNCFPDASHLEPPVDVAPLVRSYLHHHDEVSRAGIYAASALARGMLLSDGISVLRGDGSLVAYNAFIAHRPTAGGRGGQGGARRRTYETLASEVGTTLLAAFYHSQDGGSAMTP
ncbi:hypothetical protein AKJ09_10015 [Labilithrix luteola]|uniref:Uncharacterized protein n=1 Tax=Labilithrix luteola TaxID=1391654 RepID=A0A0K1QCG9_9BACT|nr:hypothetical protein [Labilithrix luteola]AKV03352.1 hypothetical protein AKJ09_10015 [Labilithrix luteola]